MAPASILARRSETTQILRGHLAISALPRRWHRIVTIYRLTYIRLAASVFGVELIHIYECLCDRTRLRILNLLGGGPLCVCHLQEVLGESQVKVSKHLAYLKAHGLVDVKREATWRIYRLVTTPSRALRLNLACLQDCAQEDTIFRKDAAKLLKLRENLTADGPACCVSPRHSRVKS